MPGGLEPVGACGHLGPWGLPPPLATHPGGPQLSPWLDDPLGKVALNSCHVVPPVARTPCYLPLVTPLLSVVSTRS